MIDNVLESVDRMGELFSFVFLYVIFGIEEVLIEGIDNKFGF